jgi:methylated-DNA-protein-cysteine methyltransferase-like protein
VSKTRRKRPQPAPPDERYRRIYAAVTAIPRGCVASYGQVAARAGLPRGARLVGRALAACSDRLPWHRVLNAAGRISFPQGSASFREQARRLAAEGVVVCGGRVEWQHFRWRQPELDELLWGPHRRVARRGA